MSSESVSTREVWLGARLSSEGESELEYSNVNLPDWVKFTDEEYEIEDGVIVRCSRNRNSDCTENIVIDRTYSIGNGQSFARVESNIFYDRYEFKSRSVKLSESDIQVAKKLVGQAATYKNVFQNYIDDSSPSSTVQALLEDIKSDIEKSGIADLTFENGASGQGLTYNLSLRPDNSNTNYMVLSLTKAKTVDLWGVSGRTISNTDTEIVKLRELVNVYIDSDLETWYEHSGSVDALGGGDTGPWDTSAGSPTEINHLGQDLYIFPSGTVKTKDGAIYTVIEDGAWELTGLDIKTEIEKNKDGTINISQYIKRAMFHQFTGYIIPEEDGGTETDYTDHKTIFGDTDVVRFTNVYPLNPDPSFTFAPTDGFCDQDADSVSFLDSRQWEQNRDGTANAVVRRFSPNSQELDTNKLVSGDGTTDDWLEYKTPYGYAKYRMIKNATWSVVASALESAPINYDHEGATDWEKSYKRYHITPTFSPRETGRWDLELRLVPYIMRWENETEGDDDILNEYETTFTFGDYNITMKNVITSKGNVALEKFSETNVPEGASIPSWVPRAGVFYLGSGMWRAVVLTAE